MIINTLQSTITIPVYRAILYTLQKIYTCSTSLFSLMQEEGNGWKTFFSANYCTSRFYSVGSKVTKTIAKTFFYSSSPHKIDTSNPSIESLDARNTAWIQEHSLFQEYYPDLNVSSDALLDIISSNNTDSEGVIQFVKKFCANRGNAYLSKSVLDWEKAYREQQAIQKSKNQPEEIEQISRELFQRAQALTGVDDHMVLLVERESNFDFIRQSLEEVRSRHDMLYQNLYSRVKEKLHLYLNTNCKKRLFTEIQEEVRAILLGQYSDTHQQSTLGYNLPPILQQMLSNCIGLTPIQDRNESLTEVVWDLFMRHSIEEAPGQPISAEKIQQIFEKEFKMITRGIEDIVISRISQFLEKLGDDIQPLLQIWNNKLLQKERGWLEITSQSDEHYRINLYEQDRISFINSTEQYGESSPIKVYSYENILKNLLQTDFFSELLYSLESDKSSPDNTKQFLSQFGTLTESYIPSSTSKAPKNRLLNHIKTYCSQVDGSSEWLDTTFFQIRLHAFVNYCKSAQKSYNVTHVTLSNIETGISALFEDANTLYDMGNLSDQEYIAIIATGLEIEEYVLQKQQKLQSEVQSSEIIIPEIIKEQLHKVFSLGNISKLDIENIKSFAKVLLGSDMEEEIILLCKELPIINPQTPSSYFPSYISLLQVMKNLCIDVKNLRASPIALFRVYSDIQRLLNDIQGILTLLSCMSYICLLASCTNPVITLSCVVIFILGIRMLYSVPQLEPILDLCISMWNFHREVYKFAIIRLMVRLLQIADKAIHWNEKVPMQMVRSFLTKNISKALSFSLRTPMDPTQNEIPREVKPLQRFYSQMEVCTHTQNPREISHILFPKLHMTFEIQEYNQIQRAHLLQQPGFWIADTIADVELECMDLAHIVLENEQGHKKICVVPQPQKRLLLQTILRMANFYSKPSVDALSKFIQNQISEANPIVYYYDVIDGEMSSQEFNAIGYLITHYITSGDYVKCQRLLDQLKKMKVNGREDSDATLKILEQIAYIVPSSIHPNITKIILELSALCREIPLESKAFPLFIRSYQSYILSKERNHVSYLSEAEESVLLDHLNDRDIGDSIPSSLRKLWLASCTALPQTVLLLANNILDGFSNITIFGKEGYVPTSLQKYQTQQKYLYGDSDKISLLIELISNNLIHPYLFLNKDVINIKKVFHENKGDIFDVLPLIFSKLSMEGNSTKSDYVALCMIIYFVTQNATPSSNTLKKVAKSIKPLIMDIPFVMLSTPSIVHQMSEKFVGSFFARHITRTGVKTLQDYMGVDREYAKHRLIHDTHSKIFPQLHIDDDYISLQTLEKSILKNYQKIDTTFLQKQRGVASHTNLQLERESSIEDQMNQMMDWYEGGRARESNSTSYTLRPDQNMQNLTRRLTDTYDMLRTMSIQQIDTINHLLSHPPQNLSLLSQDIEQCTQNIRNNSTAVKSLRRQMSNIYENQSTIGKIGTLALRYINSLLEVPTFGHVSFFPDTKIQSLVQKQSHLLQEAQSIKSKREQLFQSMIVVHKPVTALGLNEVYAYFCQGKDASIIESLNLDDNQWTVIKEQLYRYLLLQKYLSHAEYIMQLSTDTSTSMEEKMDLIGHELESMSQSIQEFPVLEISIRSQLQFEQKLSRSLSSLLRNSFDNMVDRSMENLQSIYQFSRT